MPIKIDMPKGVLKSALEQAISLRRRNVNAATNELIRNALEDEIKNIRLAMDTMTEIK